MFSAMEVSGHESVLFGFDPQAGYRGIIAVHSTRLGPAVGGTRYWRYTSTEAALTDALRLSEGMSYKNALAGLPFGGGKGVIMDTGAADRKAVFEAHARQVNRLGGQHITAEDVGTTVTDMETMRRISPHVAGLASGAGDPSPYTARGVRRAIQAALLHRFRSDKLEGRTIAVQGLGAVGYHLARDLAGRGARLIVHDVVDERMQRAADELGARVVPDVIGVTADVFAPCALGGVLNVDTVARLDCRIVAGAANNQLADAAAGDAMVRRGITYCPDFIANAGGVLSGAHDILGWSMPEVTARIDRIYDTTLAVLHEARDKNISPAGSAVALAKRVIAGGKG
ncbi:MAG: Glu/Leu/Phe/Val dehydrogenase dimerization domain-containing protein [Gemmatimonadota bacterium]